MVVALVILGALVLAGVAVLVATQRGTATGALSRETKQRDAGRAGTPAAAAEADDDESTALARARADETRDQAGGVPAVSGEGGVTRWEPIDEEELGVTRRQFFNRGILAAVGLGVGALGTGVLAFLWPSASGGFGGVVNTGRKVADLVDEITTKRTPAYFAEARAYVNPYPTDKVEAAQKAGYPDAVIPDLEQGIIVLYQKCPHLGCRVPWCETSQWFECPCHGSKYNRVGEKRDGPAPQGMYQFRGVIGGDGSLSIDTGTVIIGLPIGTDTTGQKPEGPFCV